MEIKSYTTIEQSRKLVEFLPLESADMYHFIHSDNNSETIGIGYDKTAAEFYSKTQLEYIPCWSLAALLDILPKEIVYDKHIVYLEFHIWEYSIEYVNNADYTLCVTKNYDNPVDACYEMVICLHELNLL